MGTAIAHMQTPEEQELEKKRAELAVLEEELAQRELEVETLEGELRSFERHYLRMVGVKYAELDEIEAQIAEHLARAKPKNKKAQAKAQEARLKAEDSAGATQDAVVEGAEREEFKPSESLKKLYREAAKSFHPDLTTDEDERERRHRFMAEANQAYQDRDEERLQAILREWKTSPDTVKGEGVGADLVRTIRKIAQVQARLSAIDEQMESLKKSDLYRLRMKVIAAEEDERDLLTEMAEQLDGDIAEARKRLETLTISRGARA